MKRKRIIISTISIIILLGFITIFILIKNRSLASDISFTSKNYHIDDNIITNISPNTDIELFYKYFDTTNCSITVTNENNEPLTNGFIYTGSKTNVFDTTHNLVNSYTNIITGDINFDGIVDIKDIETLATYLIEENNLDDHQKKAIDINKDNEIKINDLTLLESYLNSSYESITFNNDEIILMSNEQERLVPTINPNIILNQNLNWTSSNEEVIEVDESGKITANNEGESIITATTKDGSKEATKRIVVDNTIRLSKTTATGYTGGDDIYVDIKSLDYNNITCNVENVNTNSSETIANCTIENKKLIISPVNDGDAIVTITHPEYGEAKLNLNIIFTYFNLFPKAWCLTPNTSVGNGTISGFNFGTIRVKSISNNQIVRRGYIITNNGIKTFGIESGSQTGDANVIFEESNGHNEVKFTAYVYQLYLTQRTGTTTIGEDLTTTINAENVGNISCNSSNNELATCEIDNNTLIVHPLAPGNVTINITGDKCGTVTYNAVITQTTPEPDEGGVNQ